MAETAPLVIGEYGMIWLESSYLILATQYREYMEHIWYMEYMEHIWYMECGIYKYSIYGMIWRDRRVVSDPAGILVSSRPANTFTPNLNQSDLLSYPTHTHHTHTHHTHHTR